MSKAKRLQDKHFSPLLAAHEKEPHGADQIMGANHHAGGIHPDYYGNWKRTASVLLGSLLHEILDPRFGRCVGDMGIDGLHALHCLTTGLGHHLSVGARREPIMDASHAVWWVQGRAVSGALECCGGMVYIIPASYSGIQFNTISLVEVSIYSLHLIM